MAIALDRPTLLTPGLKPVDPSFESWWVRPGGATVVFGHDDAQWRSLRTGDEGGW